MEAERILAEVERSILGAILLNNDCLSRVRERLEPLDFSLDSHRIICLSMMRVDTLYGTIDLVTVSRQLENTGLLEAAGGVAYLSSLTAALPRNLHIDKYIDILKATSVVEKAECEIQRYDPAAIWVDGAWTMGNSIAVNGEFVKFSDHVDMVRRLRYRLYEAHQARH